MVLCALGEVKGMDIKMNVFEKRKKMLEKNEEVFEQYCRNEKTGILISDARKEYLKKTGSELLSGEIKERFEETRSIYYYNILNKPLLEYTFPEWVVCLQEKALLEYAVPIFSRVLVHYPMLCGKNCEWEILYEIAKVDEDFWNVHEGWKRFFVDILNNVLCDNGVEKEPVINEKFIEQFCIFISECF